MSDGDVHGNEMDAPHDFDDAATEALLAGSGRDVAPELADLVADMRIAYTSSPPPAGAALATFLAATDAVPGPTSRRFDRMKSSMLAKIGAATAAVVAATGGLAMASALPAPVQDAVSHLGVGAPSHHSHANSTVEVSPADSETTTSVDPTATTEPEPTTVPGDNTSTTVELGDNHGGVVSGVAHDDNGDGCEHGHAVSNVASGGAAQGQPCPTTTTTVGDGTTPSTIADNNGDNSSDNSGDSQGDNQDKHHGTTDTTVGNGTTPTTIAGGGDHGGDTGGGSGDHGGGGGDHGGDTSGGGGNN